MKQSVSLMISFSLLFSAFSPSINVLADSIDINRQERVNVVVENDSLITRTKYQLSDSNQIITMNKNQKYEGWFSQKVNFNNIKVKNLDTQKSIYISQKNSSFSTLSSIHSSYSLDLFEDFLSHKFLLKNADNWLISNSKNILNKRYSYFKIKDKLVIKNPKNLLNMEWEIKKDAFDKNAIMIYQSINGHHCYLSVDKNHQLRLARQSEAEKKEYQLLKFKFEKNMLVNKEAKLKLSLYHKDLIPTYVVKTSSFDKSIYHKDTSDDVADNDELSAFTSSKEIQSTEIESNKTNSSSNSSSKTIETKDSTSLSTESSNSREYSRSETQNSLPFNSIKKNKNIHISSKKSLNQTTLTIQIPLENVPTSVSHINVDVMAGDKKVDQISLTPNNHWSGTLKNLPYTDNKGNEIQYDAVANIEGYTSESHISKQKAEDYANGFVIQPATTVKSGSSYYLLTSNSLNNKTSLLRKTNFLSDSDSVSEIGLGNVQNKQLYDINGNIVPKYVKFKSQDDVSYLQWNAKGSDIGKIFESNFMILSSHKNNFLLQGMNGQYKCVEDNSLNKHTSNTVFMPISDQGYTVNRTTIYPYEPVEIGNHSSITLELNKIQSKPDTPNYIPNEYTNFTVNKKWDSSDHPSSIKVNLMKNGVKFETITLNEKNHWIYTFENLPLIDESGKEIKYSVSENPVEGYTSSYSEVSTGKTTETSVWLPATHWQDGHEYIMVTSPNTGAVNALEDCGKKWQWNGHTINVSGSANAKWPTGTYITDEEAHKNGGAFIWKTELYKEDAKIDHLNGLHDLYTLVGHNGKIASLQGAQDMVDYGHKGQTNCQWFYGDYQGGKNVASEVTEDEWPNVMGGANFYFILSGGGTGDANHKEIPLWYAYEKHNIKVKEQSMTITNMKNVVPPVEAKGEINIHKISDSDGKSLAGAEFTLTSKSDSSIVYKATTDNKGMISFKDLSYGTYILKETRAPEGYEVNDKEYEIQLSKDGIKVINLDGSIVIINNELTISNKEEKGTPPLPETGGVGNYPFLTIGFSLILLGLSCSFYIDRRRGKK